MAGVVGGACSYRQKPACAAASGTAGLRTAEIIACVAVRATHAGASATLMPTRQLPMEQMHRWLLLISRADVGYILSEFFRQCTFMLVLYYLVYSDHLNLASLALLKVAHTTPLA